MGGDRNDNFLVVCPLYQRKLNICSAVVLGYNGQVLHVTSLWCIHWIVCPTITLKLNLRYIIMSNGVTWSTYSTMSNSELKAILPTNQTTTTQQYSQHHQSQQQQQQPQQNIALPLFQLFYKSEYHQQCFHKHFKSCDQRLITTEHNICSCAMFPCTIHTSSNHTFHPSPFC